MKLALGTVQFGLDYGVSNQAGQVPQAQVNSILNLATSLGIDTLDTAAAYGESEKVLGNSHQTDAFSVVSKIAKIDPTQVSIEKSFNESLNALQQENLYGLLFHDANDLLGRPYSDQVFKQAMLLKAQGLIKKLGVSVYHPAQLSEIAARYPIDIVQLPLNLFDQRFIQGELLTALKQQDVEIHTRSAFLQGLLLMDEKALPSQFLRYKPVFERFSQLVADFGCSKLTLCLALMAQNSLIDKIVVGCCSEQQLSEIAAAYKQAQNLPSVSGLLSSLASDQQSLINPGEWSSQ